jgi:hypothetical protein
MIAFGCLLVFVASVGIAFAHARYANARDDLRPLAAATWDVVSWGAAVIGFIVAIKLSLWALPFEAAGLFVGTYAVVVRARQTHQSASVKS